MASQAMRAPADASVTSVRRASSAQSERNARAAGVATRVRRALSLADAPRSSRPLLLAFLAFLTFLGCASLQHVAHAESHDAQVVDSARCGEQAQTRAGKAWDVHHSDDASPLEDMAVADSEGPEEDAHFDAPAVVVSVTLAPLPALSKQASPVAFATWVAQRRVSSARPRGPPAFRG